MIRRLRLRIHSSVVRSGTSSRWILLVRLHVTGCMISSLDLSYSDTLLGLRNRSQRLETATNLPFDLGEDFQGVVERMLLLDDACGRNIFG